MKTIFCYNCLSEIKIEFIHLQCRKADCINHNSAPIYKKLLDHVNNQAREIRKSNFWRLFTFKHVEVHPDALLKSQDECNHTNWQINHSSVLDELCLLCARCPEDNFFLDPICPICHENLTDSLYFADTRKIVPILGGPFSGKTLLIKKMIQHFYATYDKRDEFFCVFNKDARDYFFNGNNDNHHEISRLPSTSERRSPPVIFYMGNDYRILYDIPGAYLSDTNKLLSNSQLFLNRSSIIVLFDPYSIRSLLRYLPRIPLTMSNQSADLTAHDILMEIFELFNKLFQNNESQVMNTELKIVITKGDLLYHIYNHHPDNNFRAITAKLLKIMERGDSRTDSKIIFKEWLTTAGLKSFVLNMQNHFSRVKYFIVSSLGSSPVIFKKQVKHNSKFSSYSIGEDNAFGLDALCKSV